MAEQRFVIRGDIDLGTARGVLADFYEQAGTRADDLVVDCAEVTSIDPIGVAVLAGMGEVLRRQHRGFRVEHIDEGTERAMVIAGLTEHVLATGAAEPVAVAVVSLVPPLSAPAP